MSVAKRILAGLRGAKSEVRKVHERHQQQAAAPRPPTRPAPGTPEATMWEFRDLMFAAGVSEADLEKALEGRFIPFGALGDEPKDLTREQNNQLYFDDEYDARRGKMRKLVFGVQDKKARKKIIAKHIQGDDLYAAKRCERNDAMRREVAKAQKRLRSGEGWGSAAATVGVLVALGYWWFNIAGAIGGAVVGFFLGQGQVHSVRTRLAEQARQAEEECQEAMKEDEEDERMQPAFFSALEAHTGEEDAEFGDESAFGNRIRMFDLKNKGGPTA